MAGNLKMTLGRNTPGLDCPFVKLGKKPEDLTVNDMLGLLEGEKQHMVLSMTVRNWEAEYKTEARDVRKNVNNLKK